MVTVMFFSIVTVEGGGCFSAQFLRKEISVHCCFICFFIFLSHCFFLGKFLFIFSNNRLHTFSLGFCNKWTIIFSSASIYCKTEQDDFLEQEKLVESNKSTYIVHSATYLPNLQKITFHRKEMYFNSLRFTGHVYVQCCFRRRQTTMFIQ